LARLDKRWPENTREFDRLVRADRYRYQRGQLVERLPVWDLLALLGLVSEQLEETMLDIDHRLANELFDRISAALPIGKDHPTRA
jgi:hypothetical protein